MTTLDFTPVVPQVHSPYVRLAAAEVAAELALSDIIAAQRAGDFDYDWVLERTHDGQQAASAYHRAYQAIARQPGGCGPVCGCPACLCDFGAIDPNGGAQ